MSEYTFKSCLVKDTINTYTITKEWRDKYLVNKCLSLITKHINTELGSHLPQEALNQVLIRAKEATDKYANSVPFRSANHDNYAIEASINSDESIVINLLTLEESVELVELS